MNRNRHFHSRPMHTCRKDPGSRKKTSHRKDPVPLGDRTLDLLVVRWQCYPCSHPKCMKKMIKLKRTHLSPNVLNYFRCTPENILSSCSLVWHSECTSSEPKIPESNFKTAQKIISNQLPAIKSCIITVLAQRFQYKQQSHSPYQSWCSVELCYRFNLSYNARAHLFLTRGSTIR